MNVTDSQGQGKALQKEFEASKNFLSSLKEEVNRIDPKVNDFEVQEFNPKDMKRVLEVTIDQTNSQKDMVSLLYVCLCVINQISLHFMIFFVIHIVESN